jgi:hypothetical protein
VETGVGKLGRLGVQVQERAFQLLPLPALQLAPERLENEAAPVALSAVDFFNQLRRLVTVTLLIIQPRESGRIPEAVRHAAVLNEIRPDVPYTRQLLALIDGLEGRKPAALERLASIDVAPLDTHNKSHLAESFGLGGDTDRALDVLEQAVEQGFYPYPFMAEHCPFLVPLRPLPRFAGILAKAKERAEAFRESESS